MEPRNTTIQVIFNFVNSFKSLPQSYKVKDLLVDVIKFHFFLAYVGPARPYQNNSTDIYMSHLSLKDTNNFLRKGTAIINMPEANPPKSNLLKIMNSICSCASYCKLLSDKRIYNFLFPLLCSGGSTKGLNIFIANGSSKASCPQGAIRVQG